MEMISDLKDHHVSVAERTVSDLDWTYFDDAYVASIVNEDPRARADLLECMQGIFLDEMIQRCLKLRSERALGGTHG